MNNKSCKSCVAMLNCTLQKQKKEKRLRKNVSLFSRGDRIRTCDHLVPNQARYRTALHPVGVAYVQVPQLRNPLLLSERSRGDRIRTCDHLVPNQARYRTALHPVSKLRMQRYNYFLTQPKFNTCFFTKHHNNRKNNAQ